VSSGPASRLRVFWMTWLWQFCRSKWTSSLTQEPHKSLEDNVDVCELGYQLTTGMRLNEQGLVGSRQTLLEFGERAGRPWTSCARLGWFTLWCPRRGAPWKWGLYLTSAGTRLRPSAPCARGRLSMSGSRRKVLGGDIQSIAIFTRWAGGSVFSPPRRSASPCSRSPSERDPHAH